MIPSWEPMSMPNIALLSSILTVVHNMNEAYRVTLGALVGA